MTPLLSANGNLVASADRKASLRICLSCPAKRQESPFLCTGLDPILSKTSMVSAISARMLGAKLDPLSSATALTRSAKHAAKEIIMAVLLGIDRSCPSP
ncbi:hypothetical protein RRF57_009443 [Xylaria bambusicola]|uniref:Uncharacterized protein n=1 Tax=Xylaria bambusicola TaxID=326684 RepID=A0AAN7UTK4_9PEZI